MLVREIMTINPTVLSPSDSVVVAAKKMKEIDSGVLPIVESERLTGMVTDRDITVRVVAEGKDPNATTVKDIMSTEIVFCLESDNIETASRKMEDNQIRRLAVLDQNHKLQGIISLKDLIIGGESDAEAGHTLKEISA